MPSQSLDSFSHPLVHPLWHSQSHSAYITLTFLQAQENVCHAQHTLMFEHIYPGTTMPTFADGLVAIQDSDGLLLIYPARSEDFVADEQPVPVEPAEYVGDDPGDE